MPLPSDDPTQRKPDISLAKKVLEWEPKCNWRRDLTGPFLILVKQFPAREPTFKLSNFMSLFSPIQSVMQSLKGRQYRKFIKKCAPVVVRINDLEKELQSLSDDELRAKTTEFMQRYQDGASLDDLLPEAFAVVKNGARRLCGQTIEVCDQPIEWQMVHYDVQLIGGMALHERHIAEMATGEGKPWFRPVLFILMRCPDKIVSWSQ